MDVDTRAYREEYRQRHRPAGYRGALHASLVVVAGTAMLAAAAWRLDAADLARWWWMIPATFVVANIVEYLVHRHVMHREVPGLRAMFERHTRRHHRYFTQRDIALTSADDLHAVLFPPVLLVFFATIAFAFAAAVAGVFGAAAGTLFFIVALAYYLAYEVMHLLAHVPPDSAFVRPTLVRRLVAHHQRHHAADVMRRGNFNIVLPLGDWLFGTLHGGAPVASAGADASLDERNR